MWGLLKGNEYIQVLSAECTHFVIFSKGGGQLNNQKQKMKMILFWLLGVDHLLPFTVATTPIGF